MIVVTGATGFIGRRVIARLSEVYSKDEIVCLIRDPTNDFERAGKELLSKLDLQTIEGDLVSGQALDQLPRSPRLVINLAANTDTEERDHSCNDLGLENLFDAVQPLGPGTHFVQISTTAIMAGRRKAMLPLTEGTTPEPTNEYGRSKLRAEEFIVRKAREQGFSLTICRPTTVWGKGARKNSFFDVLVKMAITRSPVARLNWPGLTDLIHVDDAAELVLGLSQRRGASGLAGIYTISNEALTLARVNRLIHERLGITYKEIKLPKLFWSSAASSRQVIYTLESLIPNKIYNPIWRATLVAENVIWADTSKIRTEFPVWKPKMLADFIDDVLD